MGANIRSLIAIAVSILFFIVWYSFIAPKYFPAKEGAKKVEAVSEDAKPVPLEAEKPAGPGPIEPKVKEEIREDIEDIKEVISRIETDDFVTRFTNYGAVPVSWELKTYTAAEGSKKIPVELVPQRALTEMPLSLSFKGLAVPERPQFVLVEEKDDLLRYAWSSEDVIVEKTYSLGERRYEIDLKVKVESRKAEAISEQILISWTAAQQKKKKGGFFSFLQSPSDIKVPVFMVDGKVAREGDTAKLGEEALRTGRVYWAGIEDRYFLSAILPRGAGGDAGVELGNFGEGEGEGAGFFSGILFPRATIAPRGQEEYKFTVYAGPKEMQLLKSVGMGLEKAIDYGWFTVIAIPILYVLKFLYGVVHNYGVAIILLTILIKIILHPISKKSMKSMKEMQKLQPRLKELKEKYKDNKERLNAEMMQLFKAHKVNPMSGCLPMVLQFPVYIALYRVLWNSIELYQAPFFWFYKDLSQPDPYFITPVLLGVSMFLQQKLTPSTTADPVQQKMMMMMPIMFAVFLAFLPVGLVVYILVNTVMTVVQQWMNNNDIRLRDILRGRWKVRLQP